MAITSLILIKACVKSACKRDLAVNLGIKRLMTDFGESGIDDPVLMTKTSHIKRDEMNRL